VRRERCHVGGVIRVHDSHEKWLAEPKHGAAGSRKRRDGLLGLAATDSPPGFDSRSAADRWPHCLTSQSQRVGCFGQSAGATEAHSVPEVSKSQIDMQQDRYRGGIGPFIRSSEGTVKARFQATDRMVLPKTFPEKHVCTPCDARSAHLAGRRSARDSVCMTNTAMQQPTASARSSSSRRAKSWNTFWPRSRLHFLTDLSRSPMSA
jgi:hypothetical protein